MRRSPEEAGPEQAGPQAPQLDAQPSSGATSPAAERSGRAASRLKSATSPLKRATREAPEATDGAFPSAAAAQRDPDAAAFAAADAAPGPSERVARNRAAGAEADAVPTTSYGLPAPRFNSSRMGPAGALLS